MSDLQPFEHGEEGTHFACQAQIERFGGKTKCCSCTGHKCIKGDSVMTCACGKGPHHGDEVDQMRAMKHE